MLRHDSLLKKVIEGQIKGSLAGNVTGLVDEKRIPNGLFTAKEDDKRQN